MVNVNKLRGAVVEHGFTMESLATLSAWIEQRCIVKS